MSSPVQVLSPGRGPCPAVLHALLKSWGPSIRGVTGPLQSGGHCPRNVVFPGGGGGEGRVDKVIFGIFVFVLLAYLQPPSIPRYYFFRKSLLFEGGPVRCQWPAGGAWSLRVLVLNLCGLSCTFPALLGDEKPPLTS